jgi:hypothetical protein
VPDSGFTHCVIIVPSEDITQQYWEQGWKAMRWVNSGKDRWSIWYAPKNGWAQAQGKVLILAGTGRHFVPWWWTPLFKTLKIITLFTKKHLSWLNAASNIYLIKANNRRKVTSSECFSESRGNLGIKTAFLASRLRKPGPEVLMKQSHCREEQSCWSFILTRSSVTMWSRTQTDFTTGYPRKTLLRVLPLLNLTSQVYT